MSLAIATRGIISGFRVGGGEAPPIYEPGNIPEEYEGVYLSGAERVKPIISGKELKPRIKISGTN
jgi:hypothetical protein